MIFNKENCDSCVHSFINDGIDGVNKVNGIISSFIQKYEIKDDDVFKNEFRDDIRMLFKVFQDTFGSELTMNEFQSCMNDNDNDIDDRKEYEKYLVVIGNIQYVLDHIDTVDIYNPDKDFELNCAYVFSYFNKKNKEMNNLTDTMKKATQVLDKLKDTLDHMTANMHEIDTNSIDTTDE